MGEVLSFTSHLSLQRSQIDIFEDDDVLEIVESDILDLVLMHTALSSKASLSISFRCGQAFKDDSGLVWSIHGEAGEIKVTASGSSLHVFDCNARILIHKFQDIVEEITWDWQNQDLSGSVRNVASMFQAFLDKEVRRYADSDDTL